jgi:hypothetical protein
MQFAVGSFNVPDQGLNLGIREKELWNWSISCNIPDRS